MDLTEVYSFLREIRDYLARLSVTQGILIGSLYVQKIGGNAFVVEMIDNPIGHITLSPYQGEGTITIRSDKFLTEFRFLRITS